VEVEREEIRLKVTEMVININTNSRSPQEQLIMEVQTIKASTGRFM